MLLNSALRRTALGRPPPLSLNDETTIDELMLYELIDAMRWNDLYEEDDVLDALAVLTVEKEMEANFQEKEVDEILDIGIDNGCPIFTVRFLDGSVEKSKNPQKRDEFLKSRGMVHGEAFEKEAAKNHTRLKSFRTKEGKEKFKEWQEGGKKELRKAETALEAKLEIKGFKDEDPNFIAQVILYNEKDIRRKPVGLRIVYDILSKRLGLESSPLSLTLRVKQVACSDSYTSSSTALDFPTVEKSNKFRNFEDALANALPTNSESEAKEVMKRAKSTITEMNEMTPLKKKEEREKIIEYAKKFEESNRENVPALYGVDCDLDPTKIIDLGKSHRKSLEEMEHNIKIENTTLKDSEGKRHEFHGAFWHGDEEIKSGTKLGYLKGRILSSCEVPDKHYSHRITQKSKFLIDCSVPAHSNWTRYINDGHYGQEKSRTNVMFGEDGAVIATRKIEKGDEILAKYSEVHWIN